MIAALLAATGQLRGGAGARLPARLAAPPPPPPCPPAAPSACSGLCPSHPGPTAPAHSLGAWSRVHAMGWGEQGQRVQRGARRRGARGRRRRGADQERSLGGAGDAGGGRRAAGRGRGLKRGVGLGRCGANSIGHGGLVRVRGANQVWGEAEEE
jgi:hypothetical protein